MLAIITSTVFTPLIVFHFIVARMSSSDDYYCYGQKCSRNSWPLKNDILSKVNKGQH